MIERASGANPSATEDFDPLMDRWLRTDGDYMLEIWAVSPEGAVEAAYLNPGPIHVERAHASRSGDAITLFVELRDVNYPGSTYDLRYDRARDVLEGTYFQAAEGQTFEVSFARQ